MESCCYFAILFQCVLFSYIYVSSQPTVHYTNVARRNILQAVFKYAYFMTVCSALNVCYKQMQDVSYVMLDWSEVMGGCNTTIQIGRSRS